MNVSKLRGKEEAEVAAAKVAKVEVAAKPMSMMDEMRNRMARRNNAISGRKDKASTAADSLLVKQAQEDIPAPPPRRAALPTAADSDSDDDRPKAKTAAPRAPAVVPPPPQVSARSLFLASCSDIV